MAHIGDQDTLGAVVERARALVERVCLNPHDGRDAGGQRGLADFAGFGDGDRAVLHVDGQPLIPGGAGELGDRDAADQPHAETERDLARPEMGQRLVGYDAHRVLRAALVGHTGD